MKANLPFEVKPLGSPAQRRGILLIHGLGDSPWSFVDISQSLAEQGFLVRTVLLSGHGTRPADLINADFRDWQTLVEKQVALLKQEVDEVYLGGFSTGGNLAFLYAEKDNDIRGLMLFSPGFQTDEPLISLTPAAALFRDWLRSEVPGTQTNIARYFQTPTNGFAQYYQTSKRVLDSLEDDDFDRPVFMVLTEHDSVLEVNEIRRLFNERFTHPDNRLMWFGSEPSAATDREIVVNGRMPEFRISNMSHMGILFSPENSYYGINGTERICRNGQEVLDAMAFCQQGNPVWYSAWGYQEEGKVHARLTFNPVFEQMMEEAFSVFDL
ncbi:alpha/beta hydrolase [Endozoicomonas ascidiicola]|uniref:alpha/beta hydrolase n=1 Tax=Endozoicomonas ascidiicola TaxID=1698521 RepID=UPI00082A9E5A|nr:alpha/beta fold hydrolase [Endozoicomonas ascidiicola]